MAPPRGLLCALDSFLRLRRDTGAVHCFLIAVNGSADGDMRYGCDTRDERGRYPQCLGAGCRQTG